MNQIMQNEAKMKTISNLEVSAFIPHGAPFRLVDSVDIISESHFIGRKYIGWNEPFFQGHFPGSPIMPGVLQIEAAAQTACVGMSFVRSNPFVTTVNDQTAKSSEEYQVRLGTIDRARFYKPVLPGCILQLEVKMEKKMSNIYVFSGNAKVEEDTVVDFEFKAAIFRSENTLSIIKPDAVHRADEIVEILKLNNLNIQNLCINEHIIPMKKKVRITREAAEKFYSEHSSRPFFGELCEYMCSGDSIIMILRGYDAVSRYRKLMGSTDPTKAESGTLRKIFGKSIEANAVHGSDSMTSAEREIAIMFPEFKNP